MRAGIGMKEVEMVYRAYYGTAGAGRVPPLEKGRWPFREFSDLDQALAWAERAAAKGTTVLAVEGDDGTQLAKGDIASAFAGRGL
jgi:hypothetical protein